jgi:SAM-dependent methyltransferase
MPSSLQFTGERFVPGAPGAIAYEHCHRYVFARRFVGGKRVLDAACGEGYGSALLASAAGGVIGVDVDGPTVIHASAAYGARANVRFVVATVTDLPFAAASFDVVVCFETIEHLGADEQPRMLAEFARVLAPEGFLVLSSPNKRRYSDESRYENPYHAQELYRPELARLLESGFPHQRWFHQQPLYASALWAEIADHDGRCEAWCGAGDTAEPMTANDGLYYIVVAAAGENGLPRPGPRLSLYADREDSELARAEANAADVLRLDALLKDRDAALDRQAAHVAHLETLVGERERLIVERDRELAAVNAARTSVARSFAAAEAARAGLERDVAEARAALASSQQERDAANASLAQRQSEFARAEAAVAALQQDLKELEAALAAQERIITYQRSLRGWLRAPLGWALRARRHWLGDA